MNQDLDPAIAFKPVVYLVFRKKNPELRSIEKVFSIIAPIIKSSYQLQYFFLPYYSSSVSRIFANLRAVRALNDGISHVTGDAHYVILGLYGKKTILTIHDNVFMEKSSGLKKLVFKWLFIKWPVKAASLVTTISEKTKSEIIKYSGCNSDKIIVIPNPVEQFIYFREQQFDSDCPRVLFVGTTPNKNLERVIVALQGIRCRLLIVGNLNEMQASLLEQKAIDFKNVTNVSGEELADAYANSDMVLYPSLYEGFGLPVIEGQKAGRVVVTSSISPLQETAGGGACLVNPYVVESIRDGILRVIREKEYRETLIQKGFDNVKQYAPEIIAAHYMRLYQQLQAK